MGDLVKSTSGYQVGEFDRRPWGCWLVTKAPEKDSYDYCEKIIVVASGKILSLQSHKLRHETWTVLDGTLITIIDGESVTLDSGQTIEVPVGAPHSMANLSDSPCIVKERQTGICRENDIIRYLDAYGRITAGANEKIMKSVDLYNAILQQTEEKVRRYA